ncbi:MAG: hypothetical protein ACD_37C00031G0005 [uncultured bacterium]|nr:MAG: hypothetical protein ACD_37C00031G0005 [uncultured bacterium]KKP95592.1 MAG: UDP-N-acetylmuramyl-tripeptide synthetase [Candidatus Levybacteria bacterium GW2011_GWA2_36_13]KKQ00740.1 MAG: UDP-N-acetylmuramyl-tripeptide synthetase [Candidatus Levybacteria bacterium GW2011_GWB1_36_18]KKQ58529.1 MAG: UDP-N-acetylmuramyl-tripeptide synthetase, UDP-N-acetylmuramoylalanyl-D-glutamate-2,6-diaminopimelate ligase [Microgenomates group bacterium GW2011_GWC1_38_14]KKR17547.1 MAG: UDP-N-acetylmuram
MWQGIKNIYHLFVSMLVNIIFFFPGRWIKVVGVTGTDGKTTTVALITHILEGAGYKISYITSIEAVIGGKKYETGFHVTTPSSFSLQKYLWRAILKKSEFFILEVTSHAIDQQRIWGIPFLVGVLTNVTEEHLDYHKTYDKYLKTKEKLLKLAKFAIVNRDDASYTLLSESKNKKDKEHWITYGFSESSDINLGNFKFNTTLLGDFNKFNILAAVATCRTLGIKDEIIRRSIETFKEPKGRLDFVYDKDFSVMIDFAHTPSAFESILSSLKPLFKGKIIHVFGSAGNRDAAKRPFMGEISSKYADVVVLTSEDPRKEKVEKIMEEIEAGIKKIDATVIKIPDRREAIEAAIQMVGKGDLVLITGKAHEKSMNLGNGEIPWDEYEVVKKALSEKYGK